MTQSNCTQGTEWREAECQPPRSFARLSVVYLRVLVYVCAGRIIRRQRNRWQIRCVIMPDAVAVAPLGVALPFPSSLNLDSLRNYYLFSVWNDVESNIYFSYWMNRTQLFWAQTQKKSTFLRLAHTHTHTPHSLFSRPKQNRLDRSVRVHCSQNRIVGANCNRTNACKNDFRSDMKNDNDRQHAWRRIFFIKWINALIPNDCGGMKVCARFFQLKLNTKTKFRTMAAR